MGHSMGKNCACYYLLDSTFGLFQYLHFHTIIGLLFNSRSLDNAVKMETGSLQYIIEYNILIPMG